MKLKRYGVWRAALVVLLVLGFHVSNEVRGGHLRAAEQISDQSLLAKAMDDRAAYARQAAARKPADQAALASTPLTDQELLERLAVLGLVVAILICSVTAFVIYLRQVESRAKCEKASKRIGLIEYDAEEKMGCTRLAGWFMTPALLGASLAGYTAIDDPRQRTPAMMILGIGVALGLIGLYTWRSSRKWRSRRQSCRGVIWDAQNGEACEGRFEIELAPGVFGSSFMGVASHPVKRFSPCADTPLKPIAAAEPVLAIRLVKEQDATQYHPAHVSFVGQEIQCSSSRICLLLDDRMTTIKLSKNESRWRLRLGLRSIGRLLNAFTPQKIRVQIAVELPKLSQGPDLETRLQVNSAAGYGVGLITGLGGVAGAIAGIAGTLGSSPGDDVASKAIKEMEALLFGETSRPDGSSLQSLSEEFGWSVEAAGGTISPNLDGSAPARQPCQAVYGTARDPEDSSCLAALVAQIRPSRCLHGRYRGYDVFSDGAFIEFAKSFPPELEHIRQATTTHELSARQIEHILPRDASHGAPILDRYQENGQWVLSSSRGEVRVDATLFDYLQWRFPDVTPVSLGEYRPILFVSSGEIRGMLMPMSTRPA